MKMTASQIRAMKILRSTPVSAMPRTADGSVNSPANLKAQNEMLVKALRGIHNQLSQQHVVASDISFARQMALDALAGAGKKPEYAFRPRAKAGAA